VFGTAAGCGSSNSSPTSPDSAIPATIEVYPQTYFSWLPVIAQGEGFFAKNGISARIVPVAGGGPVAMDALANGSADIAMADLSIAGPLLEKGVPLEVVSGAVNASWTLVGPAGAGGSASSPSDVKALDGKTIGVIVVGGSGYYFMEQLAATAGIHVTYSAFGAPVANAVAALSSHRVDAEVVNPDVAAYLERTHRARILFDFSNPADLKVAGAPLSYLAGQPNGWMVARSGWATAHPGAVRQFQLAMDEAEIWAHNPANLSHVIALLKSSDELAQFDSGADVNSAVRALLPSLISYIPAATPDAYMRFWVSAGLLSHAIAASKWMNPSVPTSEAQVASAVGRATGAS
jgi:NitT/TauT family transport system substrate-binding protein